MPELSAIVSVFSRVVRTDTGRTLKATFGPAPQAGLRFTGELTPIRLMMVPLTEKFKAGEIVIDMDGTHYLAASWVEAELLAQPLSHNFILFELHGYFPITRGVKSIEPISGLTRTSGTSLVATVGALREPLTLQIDGIGVRQERYRYLVGVKPDLEDFIEGKRILRIDYANGLYFLEAQ